MVTPAFVDLCLAPSGECVCAAKLEQHGTLSTPPGSAPDPCWRVRVPWWSQSSVLLAGDNLHEQLLRQREVKSSVQARAEARIRTPSPPSPRRVSEQSQPPPPFLRFAPPLFVALASNVASSVSNVVRRRKKPRGRGDGESGRGDGTLAETSSQDGATEWETSSYASAHRGRRSGPSYIATNLSYLESKDHTCVIVVKKITKLGFDAAERLRSHFEQWGPVEEVLHSSLPIRGEPAEHTSGMRRRAPGMGWVVMKNAEDARRALSHGEVHMVGSAPIHAAAFVKKNQHQSSETIAEDSEED